MVKFREVTRVRSNIDTHIVFVHGWFGDSDDTWIKDTASTYFDLPAVLEAGMQNTKVWKFGYKISNSNYITNTHIISRISSKLISNIMNKKTMKNGKIIFVTHSLGGIIVKKAIEQLSHSHPKSSHSDMFNQIKGVVFLATPHIGTELVEWLDKKFNAGKKFKGAQKEVFKLLFPGNNQLIKLKKDFELICKNNFIKKIDFRELLKTNIIKYKSEIEKQINDKIKIDNEFMKWYVNNVKIYRKIIVDKHSSYSGFHKKPIKILKNHENICKPNNKKYKVYRRIKYFIEECW